MRMACECEPAAYIAAQSQTVPTVAVAAARADGDGSLAVQPRVTVGPLLALSLSDWLQNSTPFKPLGEVRPRPAAALRKARGKH
jgi:hypothetical protein